MPLKGKKLKAAIDQAKMANKMRRAGHQGRNKAEGDLYQRAVRDAKARVKNQYR